MSVSGVPSGTHDSRQYRRKALPIGLVRRVLRRQQQRIFELYAELFPPTPGQRILDLGVNGALDRRDQHFFEWSYPYREQVVAVGLEPPDTFIACYPEVTYVQVRRDEPLPFEEDSFDVVFCSAVVEHVGSRDRQRAFLAEVARVGRAAFITTPNRWYPVELHTVLPLVHFLPTRWYRALLRAVGFTFFAAEENLNLLDRTSLESVTPTRVEAWLFLHRFLGFTSNLILVWGARPKPSSASRSARHAFRLPPSATSATLPASSGERHASGQTP